MKNLSKKGIIPVVNYHLWKACNYKCKFCFGTFNDVERNNLKLEEAKSIVQSVIDFGFEKITFSGGEPTLCNYLHELLRMAKEGGMTTSIVTNGSRLDHQWLARHKPHLDWIAISIDSIYLDTNIRSGRYHPNSAFDEDSYLDLIRSVKDMGYRLKINTVVSQYNLHENLSEFIQKANPERWKIFQALPITIQNDAYKSEYVISDQQFERFLERHQQHEYIKEDNSDMRGSYVMIDPMGRFFENTDGVHKYSSKINVVGIEQALSELNYQYKKFIRRNGLYDWK